MFIANEDNGLMVLYHICVYVFAADGFDYVGVGCELEFVVSATPSHCVQIRLLADGLAESEEWFTVQLFSPWTARNAPDYQLRLKIQPSDSECLKNKVFASRHMCL